MRRGIVLIADDYGLTAGVSDAIVRLARDKRLSGTSVLVTEPCFGDEAQALAPLRSGLAIGLHVNLTLGVPLGPMPSLAPEVRFPPLTKVIRRALRGALDVSEVEAEILRQVIRFEEGFGAPPDFIDGHQHVHALPGVRDALFRILRARNYPCTPLLRNPADRLARIVLRGESRAKALLIALLCKGFAAAAKAHGFQTNDGFSGVTVFQPRQTARDFARAVRQMGPCHLMMCHPGLADAALSRLDPVTDRRQVEYDYLAVDNAATPLLWQACRGEDGGIAWRDETGERWR